MEQAIPEGNPSALVRLPCLWLTTISPGCPEIDILQPGLQFAITPFHPKHTGKIPEHRKVNGYVIGTDP